MKSPEFDQPPRPTIREATPEDAEPTRRMQAQSWLDTYPNDERGVPREWVEQRVAKWFTPEGLARTREIMADPEQFYRVAELNGQIVGFISGWIRDDDQGELAIYTEKSMHGTGLATDLMNQLDEFWRAKQVKIVRLRVADYNERAIKFYEKFGFAIVPGSEALLDEKIPNVKIERSLE